MIEEIFELVFENTVKSVGFFDLISDFIAKSDIICVKDEFGEDINVHNLSTSVQLRERMEFVYLIQFKKLHYNGFQYNFVDLYFKSIDISHLNLIFVFSEQTRLKRDQISAWYYFADDIHQKLVTSTYFMGMESAFDIGTRFFTCKEIGPIPW